MLGWPNCCCRMKESSLPNCANAQDIMAPITEVFCTSMGFSTVGPMTGPFIQPTLLGQSTRSSGSFG